MGQKIHPVGFRIGIGTNWQSRWFADSKKYKEYVMEDLKIREMLLKKCQKTLKTVVK